MISTRCCMLLHTIYATQRSVRFMLYGTEQRARRESIFRQLDAFYFYYYIISIIILKENTHTDTRTKYV